MIKKYSSLFINCNEIGLEIIERHLATGSVSQKWSQQTFRWSWRKVIFKMSKSWLLATSTKGQFKAENTLDWGTLQVYDLGIHWTVNKCGCLTYLLDMPSSICLQNNIKWWKIYLRYFLFIFLFAAAAQRSTHDASTTQRLFCLVLLSKQENEKRSLQCDQIGQFIALWTIFQSLWQQLFCPNQPHFYAIFGKVSKPFIFLMKYFLGNF